MSINKVLNLKIYHIENIKENIKLFSNYINIELVYLDNNKVELIFKGDNEEIYSKEFFNYLIIYESRQSN